MCSVEDDFDTYGGTEAPADVYTDTPAAQGNDESFYGEAAEEAAPAYAEDYNPAGVLDLLNAGYRGGLPNSHSTLCLALCCTLCLDSRIVVSIQALYVE